MKCLLNSLNLQNEEHVLLVRSLVGMDLVYQRVLNVTATMTVQMETMNEIVVSTLPI